MKRLKCSKCGSEKVLVDTRSECDGCPSNSCVQLLPADDFNEHHCDILDGANCGHVESFKDCPSYESRACEDGSCDRGDAGGAGCWLVTCAECGGVVGHLPFGSP